MAPPFSAEQKENDESVMEREEEEEERDAVSADPFPVEYLRCEKVHPVIVVVMEEEEEEGEMVRADALMVTFVSFDG